MKLVECVPNFSEGRRPEVVSAIRDAIASVEGVSVLDVSSDASHNRSVITFVAPIDRAVEAAFRGIKAAAERIDLCSHSGEHPRIGATDVVPFVPLEGSTMDDCIALARELGERVGRELEIPVYLYERAATQPSRENLADVRRGEFEAYSFWDHIHFYSTDELVLVAKHLGFKQVTFVEYGKSEHAELAGLDTRSTQIGLNTYAELTK